MKTKRFFTAFATLSVVLFVFMTCLSLFTKDNVTANADVSQDIDT